jgi:hypothetical protein
MTPPEERPASAAPRPLTAVTPPVQITQQQAGGRPSGNAPTGEAGGAGNSSTFIRRLGGPETPWDNRGGDEEPNDEEGS